MSSTKACSTDLARWGGSPCQSRGSYGVTIVTVNGMLNHAFVQIDLGFAYFDTLICFGLHLYAFTYDIDRNPYTHHSDPYFFD